MRTGIIADSHGLVSSLADAIAFLQRRDCHRIVHLGDICDSIRPETADACVRLIRDNRILAVKGNNDHAVTVNQTGRSDVPVLPSTVDYLNRLPLMRRSGTLLFAHSRPFVRELGLSSMIGSMSDRNARRFFRTCPHAVLFRGHSHSPELIWNRNASLGVSPLVPGQGIDLNLRIPCIVTCGATLDGYCQILEPDRRLFCFSFQK